MVNAATTARGANVHTAWIDGVPTVVAAGEIDVASLDRFAAEIRLATFVRGDVVVDLTDVTFIDLRGVEAICAASRRLHERGDHLSILHPPTSFQRVVRALPELASSLNLS